jgi:hypothetical protein
LIVEASMESEEIASTVSEMVEKRSFRNPRLFDYEVYA